jgi:hypothetical protein
MQDHRTHAADDGTGGGVVGKPKPLKVFLLRLAHGCSYFCLSFVVLTVLLLGGWRYLQAAPEHEVPSAQINPANGVHHETDVPADTGPGRRASRLEQSLAGQKPDFHVESSDAVIGELPIERLVFDATDVGLNVRGLFQGEQAEINSFGSARLRLRISTAALRARLVPFFEQEGLKDVQIDFGTNTVKVTAKRKVKLVGSIKLSAKARFEVTGENVIRLKVTEVETGQLNLGVSRLGLDFTETVPPLDLGGMYARVVIDELELTGGYLEVAAHAVEWPGSTPPRDALEVL